MVMSQEDPTTIQPLEMPAGLAVAISLLVIALGLWVASWPWQQERSARHRARHLQTLTARVVSVQKGVDKVLVTIAFAANGKDQQATVPLDAGGYSAEADYLAQRYPVGAECPAWLDRLDPTHPLLAVPEPRLPHRWWVPVLIGAGIATLGGSLLLLGATHRPAGDPRGGSSVGCATLALAYLLLGGLGVLGVAGWRASQTWPSTDCRILGKQLVGNARAEFLFTYAVDGQTYRTRGYDGYDGSPWLSGDQQAILARYAVGATYPCWYNPERPHKAVLAQPDRRPFLALAGAGLVLALLGGAGMWAQMRARLK